MKFITLELFEASRREHSREQVPRLLVATIAGIAIILSVVMLLPFG